MSAQIPPAAAVPAFAPITPAKTELAIEPAAAAGQSAKIFLTVSGILGMMPIPVAGATALSLLEAPIVPPSVRVLPRDEASDLVSVTVSFSVDASAAGTALSVPPTADQFVAETPAQWSSVSSQLVGTAGTEGARWDITLSLVGVKWPAAHRPRGRVPILAASVSRPSGSVAARIVLAAPERVVA